AEQDFVRHRQRARRRDGHPPRAAGDARSPTRRPFRATFTRNLGRAAGTSGRTPACPRPRRPEGRVTRRPRPLSRLLAFLPPAPPHILVRSDFAPVPPGAGAAS